MVFTLDTSGFVLMPDGGDYANVALRWEMLSPFAQGYVEALFASLRSGDLGYLPLNVIRKELAFSNLHPETLAAILKDCEAVRGLAATREAGAYFWQLRNTPPGLRAFPPLTPYLDDDGKVRLRGAA